ncbi:hypothetical protein ACO0LL_07675 [Undibacterium sp. TC4M20W]|uniref:hypothetical protein n=1 Tax=unclassified Undibacterium TaxID=2630295 RepID=UPI003BF1FFFE
MRENISGRPAFVSVACQTMLPFEIHLTVANAQEADIPGFIEFCGEIKAKPLLIELSRGTHSQQLMLSKLLMADQLDAVLEVAKNYGCILNQRAYKTSRLKIEIPLQYAEEYKENVAMSSDVYYEWHGKINFSRVEDLLRFCENHEAHLSRNSLRNEPGMRFVTLRESGSKAAFLRRVDALQKGLKDSVWTIMHERFEYCVFDDNCALDHGWLNQSL